MTRRSVLIGAAVVLVIATGLTLLALSQPHPGDFAHNWYWSNDGVGNYVADLTVVVLGAWKLVKEWRQHKGAQEALHRKLDHIIHHHPDIPPLPATSASSLPQPPRSTKSRRRTSAKSSAESPRTRRGGTARAGRRSGPSGALRSLDSPAGDTPTPDFPSTDDVPASTRRAGRASPNPTPSPTTRKDTP